MEQFSVSVLGVLLDVAALLIYKFFVVKEHPHMLPAPDTPENRKIRIRSKIAEELSRDLFLAGAVFIVLGFLPMGNIL